MLLKCVQQRYIEELSITERIKIIFFLHSPSLRKEMSTKDITALKKHITQVAVLVSRLEAEAKTQPKSRGKKGTRKPKSKTPEEVLKPQSAKPRKQQMCKKCNVPRKGHKCEETPAKEPVKE